jgi:hypothetical protein
MAMEKIDLSKIIFTMRGVAVSELKPKTYVSADLPADYPRKETRKALEAAHPGVTFNLRGGVFPQPNPFLNRRKTQLVPPLVPTPRKRGGTPLSKG